MAKKKKGEDLFESYRKYRAKMVDSPGYEPLGHKIITKDLVEEEKKRRQKEYSREYYLRNKDRIRNYQRNYWRKEHEDGNHRGDMIGNQRRVYEYLLEQYRKGNEAPRGTEIGRALGIGVNSVYTAIFHLTKKGYVGRGSYGRYLILKFPDGEQPEVQESKDTGKIFMTTEEDYNNLINLKEELKKKLRECEKERDELKEQVNNSVGHLEGLIESNETLEKKNLSLTGQVEELKGVIKVLLKYFQ